MAAVNLKKLDLNLLVVFDTVYATRNISRAAEQLALSQPAVSNALARLRELLDDPLFVRARRGVEPTIRATQIAGTVREALAMIGQQLAPAELALAKQDADAAVLTSDFHLLISDEPLTGLTCGSAPSPTRGEGKSAHRRC